MDIFSSFATDETLEVQGIWHNLSKTARVKVARSGNARYKAVLRAKFTAAQLDLSQGEEADQLAEAVLIDVMAETILVGWEGLTYQGKEAPYSVELAKTFLKVKDFRAKIDGLAGNMEAFRIKADVAQGNV